MQGWQWLFIIEGLPACALGVIAYFYLSDRPADAKWLTPDERELATADIEASRPTGHHVSHSYGQALKNKKFWGLAALGFGIMTSTSGLFLWIPSIIKNAGVTSILDIGLISAVPFLVGVIVQFLLARSSDRTQERRRHAGISALISAAGWLMLPMASQSTWAAIAVLTLIAAGTLGAMAPFWSMPPALLSGTAAAGGIATITAIAGIGNLITPVLTGWISAQTGSLALTQVLYGAVLGIGSLLMFTLVRTPSDTRI
jgi:sugar phosphate permease